MSNNKQSIELTDITAPLLAATQGLTTEDHECIISLLDCAKSGDSRRKQSQPFICEVPRIFRESNESFFIPQLVSIGPIHKENEKLKEFEWLKECYLDDLLNRCDSRPKETLEACVLNVKKLLPIIKSYYAGVIKKYSDVDLARMMVMDGCFILEFCFKHAEEVANKMQNLRIAMDLILLENQVPFFVLQALFDCSMGNQSFTLSDVLDNCLPPYIMLFRSDLLPKNSILSNVLDEFLALYIKLFRSPLPEKNPTPVVDSDSTHDHVLGYLHKCYQLGVSKTLNPIHTESSNPIHTEASELAYHSIVDLDRSGINFKPHQEDNSMTIKFQPPLFRCLPWFLSKPALLMPTLCIHDFTELILRNFIAYEQSFFQGRYYFTSYVHAMDTLIDTQEDVSILEESKVLVNFLGSNQEAADMLHKVDQNTSVTDFYYANEFKQMYEYSNRFWPNFRRTYSSTPWNVINLLAGIIVFIATVVGVIFAVLEYFR